MLDSGGADPELVKAWFHNRGIQSKEENDDQKMIRLLQRKKELLEEVLQIDIQIARIQTSKKTQKI